MRAAGEDGVTGEREAMARRIGETVAVAEALAPTLQARAAAAEAAGEVPAETLADLQDAGLLDVVTPAAAGGAELDYVALVDVAEALGTACASTAWTFAALASHRFVLALFPPAAQERVFGQDRAARIAGSFVFASGRAYPEGDGYRLSGAWPLASAVASADFVILAAVVGLDASFETREYRLFLVPRAQTTLGWPLDVMGLKATGSREVGVKDLAVPAAMTVAAEDLRGCAAPGAARNPAPLYRLPVFALLPFGFAGVALGNARGAVADFVAESSHRASRVTSARVSDYQSTQLKIAEAAARVDAARRVMRTICGEAMDDARAGRAPTMAEKVRFLRDGAFSARLAREAVDIAFAAGGAGALRGDALRQRQFRDAHAIAAHAGLNFDAAGAAYGRVALGLEPDNPIL